MDVRYMRMVTKIQARMLQVDKTKGGPQPAS